MPTSGRLCPHPTLPPGTKAESHVPPPYSLVCLLPTGSGPSGSWPAVGLPGQSPNPGQAQGLLTHRCFKAQADASTS